MGWWIVSILKPMGPFLTIGIEPHSAVSLTPQDYLPFDLMETILKPIGLVSKIGPPK